MSCTAPLGENSWKLAPGFPWISPHRHFPFADFALHRFAVITFPLVSPVSPCSESMNGRRSRGPLTQEIRGDVGGEGKGREKSNKIV